MKKIKFVFSDYVFKYRKVVFKYSYTSDVDNKTYENFLSLNYRDILHVIYKNGFILGSKIYIYTRNYVIVLRHHAFENISDVFDELNLNIF